MMIIASKIERFMGASVLVVIATTVAMLSGCASNIVHHKVYRMPANCEELASDLQLMAHLPCKFTNWHGRDEIDSLRQAKAQYTTRVDSTCVDSWVKLGDMLATTIGKTDTLIDSALRVYRIGLHVDSLHDELGARVALMHLYNGNVDSAITYLQRSSTAKSTFYDSDSLLLRLKYRDSLVELFAEYPEECELTLVRRGTWLAREGQSPFSKINGYGQITMYDYFGDEDDPDTFITRVSQEYLVNALNRLEQAQFVGLFNPYESIVDGRAEFGYVSQYHLPVYTVSMKTPYFQHEVSVYGLGTLAGDNALRDVLSISFGGERMNTPRNSMIGERLGKIAVSWNDLMSQDLVMREIKKRYGETKEGHLERQNYLYLIDSAMFVRLNYPDLTIDWKTSVNAQVKSFLSREGDNYPLTFVVNNKIYGLASESGEMSYVLDFKLDRDPYLFYPPIDAWISNYIVATTDSLGTTFHAFDDSNGEIIRLYVVPHGSDSAYCIGKCNGFSSTQKEYFVSVAKDVVEYYVK